MVGVVALEGFVRILVISHDLCAIPEAGSFEERVIWEGIGEFVVSEAVWIFGGIDAALWRGEWDDDGEEGDEEDDDSGDDRGLVLGKASEGVFQEGDRLGFEGRIVEMGAIRDFLEEFRVAFIL